MGNGIIHPIPLYYHSKETPTRPADPRGTQRYTFADYAWYIEGTKEKIMIDAGGDSRYIGAKDRPVTEVQTIEAGLKKLGLEPADIDLVILTHLHYDHVASAHLFKNARFLVQKKELEYARDPHPLFASIYKKEMFAGLDFEIIDGDAVVNDDISVFLSPGHTPGGQSVAVKTAKGLAVVTGLCGVRENFEPPSAYKGTTPVIVGTAINLTECYDSMLKIKEVADIVIPVHDGEYLNEKSIG